MPRPGPSWRNSAIGVGKLPAVCGRRPDWTPDQFMFEHADPAVGIVGVPPSSTVIRMLADSEREAEVQTEKALAGTATAPIAWNEFCETLVKLEAKGLQLWGPAFSGEPSALSQDREGDPLLAGRVRPWPARDAVRETRRGVSSNWRRNATDWNRWRCNGPTRCSASVSPCWKSSGSTACWHFTHPTRPPGRLTCENASFLIGKTELPKRHP